MAIRGLEADRASVLECPGAVTVIALIRRTHRLAGRRPAGFRRSSIARGLLRVSRIVPPVGNSGFLAFNILVLLALLIGPVYRVLLAVVASAHRTSRFATNNCARSGS